jgi:hypothetical protein
MQEDQRVQRPDAYFGRGEPAPEMPFGFESDENEAESRRGGSDLELPPDDTATESELRAH